MPPNHALRTTTGAVGSLLFVMVLLSILHGLAPSVPAWPACILGWLAAGLLAPTISPAQRIQVIAMLLFGGAGVLLTVALGGRIEPLRILSVNQAMIAMLAAVSFLRLVTQPADVSEALPRGRPPLWRTLLGIHFLGSVINMSAIVIMGDRLSANRPLSAPQACVLSRGFALAACWSPFFAAMGIALSSAPGARLTTLALVGFPIALCGLLLTGWSLTRGGAGASFYGYPMQFATLWIPALLALLLMLLHHLWPAVPILTLIALLSLGVTLSLLLLRHGGAGFDAYCQHIRVGLPRMSGELLLFLSAGVLASGIAGAASASGIDFTPERFGATQASLLLMGMVAVSVLGIHPVISIAISGGILAPIGVDPNLLGITFLMTWAIGISSAPLSGLHLTIQARYQVRGLTLLRMNAPFALAMLAIASLAMHLYEAIVSP
ncbi:MAG: hypothetical protein OQL28_00995 [Sedimenticola sp.]|nr:hypothetical protein [Sedimenticola sp.]